jgi:hypothetical protein
MNAPFLRMLTCCFGTNISAIAASSGANVTKVNQGIDPVAESGVAMSGKVIIFINEDIMV